jgi:hypothetical protein
VATVGTPSGLRADAEMITPAGPASTDRDPFAVARLPSGLLQDPLDSI